MSVYVDSPTEYPPIPGVRWRVFSHMWADTEEELQEMGDRIGLRRAWFQPGPPAHSIAHYDVTPGKRTLAIRAGAVARELERSDFPRLRALAEAAGRG